MTEIECRGLLLDMDGVLVDSTPAVARVWSRWAEMHGLDPESVVKQAHGRPSLATIVELLPNAGSEVTSGRAVPAANTSTRAGRAAWMTITGMADGEAEAA